MDKEVADEVIAILAPHIDVNDEEIELVSWEVSHNEKVEKDELLCLFETAKTTHEMECEHSGIVFLLAKEKQKIKVGEIIAYVGDTIEVIEKHILQNEQEKIKEESDKECLYTEKAKLLANKYQVKIEEVPCKGSIIKEKDVITFVNSLNINEVQKKPEAHQDKKLPDFITEYIEPIGELSLHKQQISKHLAETQSNVIFTTSEIEICIEEANLFLEKKKASSSNINLFHLFIFNVSELLEDFKLLKSFYHNGEVFRYKDTNLSFTVVDAENDYHLYTPVIINSSKIPLEEVALKCNELTLDIFRNEMSIKQMIGGCFTLSMLTGLEIKRFTALQNQYQSAILAIGSPYEKLVMQDDNTVSSKLFINLTLSYDHQLCDGYYTGQFLTELKHKIEQLND